MLHLPELFGRERRQKERGQKERRKELTEEEFKKLIETDFPNCLSHKDRRVKPRRKTDREQG